MIVINDFTELKSDPRSGGISAADFGASKFCFDVDTVTKLIAVWNDETGGEELNFKIYDFDRKLKFCLREPIIYAKFEPRAHQIWLARRDGEEQISILIYDYDGELKSNLSLPDELGNSDVWMDELPQIGGMAVDLGAGQDGSRSFLLHADGSELNLTAKLEGDFSFLFALEGGRANERESELGSVPQQAHKQNGADGQCEQMLERECLRDQKDTLDSKCYDEKKREQKCALKSERENAQKIEQPREQKNNLPREAVLLNFYEGRIAIVSYPKLKPLREFRFPDELTLDGKTREFMLGGIVPINEKIWLVRDDGYFRHYLFDADKFEFIAEIALAGFEPKAGSLGEIASSICDIDFRDDKLIFTHYELAGDGEQTREINHYFEADAAVLGQIFTTKRACPLKI